jgi:hypothetical protein
MHVHDLVLFGHLLSFEEIILITTRENENKLIIHQGNP